jgi:hypothetical protein
MLAPHDRIGFTVTLTGDAVIEQWSGDVVHDSCSGEVVVVIAQVVL